MSVAERVTASVQDDETRNVASGTCQIELTRGKVAIVDVEDFSLLSQVLWHAYRSPSGIWYAVHAVTRNDPFLAYAHPGVKNKVWMHRVILRVFPGTFVDHINGDGLLNVRSNLRVCSKSENDMNRGLPASNTSGLKGVTPRYGRWRAAISKDHRQIHLGCFATPEEAASAYDRAARKLYGDFAWLNFPGDTNGR